MQPGEASHAAAWEGQAFIAQERQAEGPPMSLFEPPPQPDHPTASRNNRAAARRVTLARRGCSFARFGIINWCLEPATAIHHTIDRDQRFARRPREDRSIHSALADDDDRLGETTHGWYGRGCTGRVTPSTHAGLPCDTIVTLELLNPGDVASMTEVPE